MGESEQIFSSCKRCKRPLKSAQAQKIGYGKTCFKKHTQEQEYLTRTGQATGENGQSSLAYFMTYQRFDKTPDILRKQQQEREQCKMN